MASLIQFTIQNDVLTPAFGFFSTPATLAIYCMTFFVFSVFPAPDSPLLKKDVYDTLYGDMLPLEYIHFHEKPGLTFLEIWLPNKLQKVTMISLI